MLALDVDGTLVGPDQRVDDDVIAALAEAAREGLRVCIATGRSYVETVDIWRQLRLPPPADAMVLVGGALVSEPDTGRTLYQRAIPWAVATEFAEALGERNCVAMALADSWRHGVDYVVTANGDHQAATRDWFSKMSVRVETVRRLAEAEGRFEPLRISAVAEPDAAARIAGDLKARFDGRLNIHAILAPNYGVTIVEAHDTAADKLTALRYVGQALEIAPSRIAAAGDDINDVTMLRGAGVGAAMPGAPGALLAVADTVAESGLARFVRDVLAGRFDP